MSYYQSSVIQGHLDAGVHALFAPRGTLMFDDKICSRMSAIIAHAKNSCQKISTLPRQYPFVFILLAVSAAAQTRQPVTVPSSELERQNLSHVAARTSQLIGIFYRDPGLLVELKRWIARDATNHGQLVSDSDLTDEAIFARLEDDVAFRSQATLLVQKYGYLVPEVNPDSSMGKERAFELQDRARMWAQYTEQQKALANQQNPSVQTKSNCLNPTDPGCAAPPPASAPEKIEQPGVIPPSVPPAVPRQGLASAGFTDLTVPTSSKMEPANISDPGLQQDLLTATQQPLGFNIPSDQSIGGPEITDVSRPTRAPWHGGGGMQSEVNMSGLPPGVTNVDYDPYSNTVERASVDTSTNVSLTIPERSFRGSAGPSQKLFLRSNPYESIPSLFDMYLQASSRPAAPQRFGMEVFEKGTRDLSKIPMDLPVGPEYVVGSGDGLSIDMWGGVVRRFYEVIDREGRLDLPEVGPVLVAGKTLAQTQELLQTLLRKQFRNVSADISLSRLRTVRVYVVGDVVNPGAYDISSLSTPLNALFAAEGPTARGSLRILKHYRGDQLIQEVDTYDLLLNGVRAEMQRLENGDSIMVPPIGAEITIEGMVRRPAIYELKGEKNLDGVLDLAGGLLPTATLRHIEVQRVIAHQSQTMLSLDIPARDGSSEVTSKLDAFTVQDGDKVRIFPIAPYNQDAVYLEGHVIRPGQYSYHEGMRVTDLIPSYKDLLPEPAARYAEIIRLSRPDYRPQVQSFNLAAALADPTNAPVLQPLDTVEIFGRYDFENPPEVAVLGDVRFPGVYRTNGDIRLSDAIHLAGGLSPDADMQDVQIFRHQPDSSLKIFSVKLSSALNGNPGDNIELSSRDRILVHRSTAAADPLTVYVKGDVERPGRYPLAAKMRVSDLIRAAGGLQQSADPTVADLTRYEWEDGKQVIGEQERINLASVLSDGGSDDNNIELHNGDVLSIRERTGWTELGSSITLRGEVVHPGTYGLRPGERLSSVLERAGGFTANAYTYGAVLTRVEVRQLEEKTYAATIQRVREQQTEIKLVAAASNDPDEKSSDESAYVQWQNTLETLVNNPPSGRVAIQISSNIRSWANTTRDIMLRTGDVLTIPKRPSFVLVQGQVYGPAAIAYRPGKSARWYLSRGGGPTNLANKSAIFVIRADGTVIGRRTHLWSEQLNATLQPGDMVVVPEKALGGPRAWKSILQNAQILSAITTSAFIATRF